MKWGQHIRNMFWTAGPALGISLVAFLVLGFLAEPKGGVSTDAALDVLEHEFNITVLNLLPLALLVVFTLKKVPPFLAILGSALFAGILACFTQWTVVKAFVDEPGRSAVGIAIKGIYAAMATGFVSKSGNAAIDTLFSRGGMSQSDSQRRQRVRRVQGPVGGWRALTGGGARGRRVRPRLISPTLHRRGFLT